MDFLAHRTGDSVAVAVHALEPGPASGGYLNEPDENVEVTLTSAVPLGHKIALKDISAGDAIIEYGVQIGIASDAIKTGDYVHVHNIRSARWQSSVA